MIKHGDGGIHEETSAINRCEECIKVDDCRGVGPAIPQDRHSLQRGK